MFQQGLSDVVVITVSAGPQSAEEDRQVDQADEAASAQEHGWIRI